MSHYPQSHELGRIDIVTLEDLPALSRDVPLDLPSIHAGWPAFEEGFDSLRGRRMMGLIYGGSHVYRMCSVRLERDAENPLGLDETTIPGVNTSVCVCVESLRLSTARSVQRSTHSSPAPTMTPPDRRSRVTGAREKSTAWCPSSPDTNDPLTTCCGRPPSAVRVRGPRLIPVAEVVGCGR